jgi:SPP1 family predicted phage head-tail adaptor
MEAGKLDRRLQFRRFTLSDDGFAQVEAWADYGPQVWAERRLVSDREQIAAAQVAARITARFVVRWSPLTGKITPKDRLICEGVEYDITGIKEIGRRVGVEISASARADQ